MITTSYYARSGLSACICFGPGLCLLVAIAFSCPLSALLALFYERGVVLLGEVIAAARAARPQVGFLRAHKVRCVSTSVAFHRHWSVASVLDQPLGPPVSVFSSYLSDIQHEFDGLLSLGPFVAAGSGIGWPSPLPD